MNISIIIPVYNEVESLPELVQWIHKVISQMELTYEIILIDDGSNDGSWEKIVELSKYYPSIRAVKFKKNYGKSAALNVGFNISKGEVVITMDADLQDSPDEIPALYNMIKKEGYDLVSGWKKKRYDPLSKTIPTKLFNWTTRKMSGIKLHDFNCGLKAYKNDVIKNIEIYGEMHRYIPVIAKWAGFCKIGEKVVTHQARKYGTSKFGIERFINGFLDLLSVGFTSKFSKKPMHFFGTLGLITFLFGFIIAIYLTIAKIFFEAYKMADRPLFYLGLLAMITGTQLFLTGFLAEMISRNSIDRNKYLIESKIDR